MSTTVDRELQGHVAAAAAGDEVAFARIVAAHHEDMRRVCAFLALAPNALAIWTANGPTLPDAPLTST